MTAVHPDSPDAGAVDGAGDGGQPAFGGSDPDTVAASALYFVFKRKDWR